VKAIAFAKLLRKDLEVAAEFSFLADSGAVLERLHFTGHVQVEYINVSSERIFGCDDGTFRTSNINKVVKKASAVNIIHAVMWIRIPEFGSGYRSGSTISSESGYGSKMLNY
jgi:hypothetical protein